MLKERLIRDRAAAPPCAGARAILASIRSEQHGRNDGAGSSFATYPPQGAQMCSPRRLRSLPRSWPWPQASSPTCCGRPGRALRSALDAPALPITVAGVLFQVPPAAIRATVQRHAGPQERIDLAFLWPSLKPPQPNGEANGRADGKPLDANDAGDETGSIAKDSDQRRGRAAVRHDRRPGLAAAARRSAEQHLSPVRRSESERRRRRPCHSPVPRRHALRGRRPHLRRRQSRPIFRSLHAPERRRARHMHSRTRRSAPPTSRCAFRATGWTIGATSRPRSTA